MAVKKNPTNSDIYRKLEAMDGRLSHLEQWKQGLDIAKSAVDKYKQEEQVTNEARMRREIFKQVGIVLGLIAIVLYIYLGSKGLHI